MYFNMNIAYSIRGLKNAVCWLKETKYQSSTLSTLDLLGGGGFYVTKKGRMRTFVNLNISTLIHVTSTLLCSKRNC